MVRRFPYIGNIMGVIGLGDIRIMDIAALGYQVLDNVVPDISVRDDLLSGIRGIHLLVVAGNFTLHLGYIRHVTLVEVVKRICGIYAHSVAIILFVIIMLLPLNFLVNYLTVIFSILYIKS